MGQLRTVIVDDDPRACEILRHHLKRAAHDAEVVAEVHTAAAAKQRLAQNDYDIAFLDVQLPDGDGFDLVPFVRCDAAIIFVTCREDQAVRAFEVNAMDYIVKPVTVARLAQTLRRVMRSNGQRDEAQRKYKSTDRIFLRGSSAGGRFVPVAEITAIVSSENYSEVLLTSGERWLVRQTMRGWEEALPSESFLRVHRTAIVNVLRIESIERNGEEITVLRLHGVRRPIAVGRRLWPRLKAQLEKRGPGQAL